MSLNKILFTFSDGLINGTGGAEKVLCTQANYFNKLGYEVTILTNDSRRGYPFYDIDNSIKFLNINEFNNRTLDKHYQFYAWRESINELNPDVIVTSNIGDVDLITRLGSWDIPIVNVCNGRPDYDFCAGYGFNRSPEWVQRLKTLYYRIDGGNVFFDSYKDYLPKGIKAIIHTIPNVVPKYKKRPDVRTNKIVSVGTIDPNQKRQHLAIKGLRMCSSHRDYELHFYGSIRNEEYYLYLLDLTKELKLTDRVFFHEPVKDIESVYDNADIFLSTSKFEGFPLALTEAMSKGLVCIGYSSCSGTNELLSKGHGILYNNLEDLSRKLDNVYSNYDEISESARNFVKRFSESHVMDLWHKLILETYNNFNK